LGRFSNLRQTRPLLVEKIPLFMLAAGSCVASVIAVQPAIRDVTHSPLTARIENALVSFVVYLRQMVYPEGLATPYPYAADGVPWRRAALAFVVLAVISTIVLWHREKRPFLLVGWLWYLGMLVPVIGIVGISNYTAHADRYTYLPEIGLAIAGTWYLAEWSAGWTHRPVILGALMTAVIATLMVCCHIQTSYWQDSETLWRRSLASTSGNHVAHDNLGLALAEKGRMREAIGEYQRAIEAKPDFAMAHDNLGNALARTGQQGEAIAEFRKALEIMPGYAAAHYNLGNALAQTGQDAEAIAEFRKALDGNPDYAAARNNLGSALVRSGRAEEAIVQYRKALETDPGNAPAHYNLANALADRGQVEEAIVHYRKALEVAPGYAPAHYHLGNALALTGHEAEATAEYSKTLEINPGDVEARESLGLAFLEQGKTKEAMDCWQRALDLDPDRLPIRNNLAWLLATTPDASLRDGAKALALATRSDETTGGTNTIILRTLAAAYAETGRFGDASSTARHALGLAVEQKSDTLADKLRSEIKLYQAGLPVRDAAP
jgi:tetratricopeptide (TPR) repeat protein